MAIPYKPKTNQNAADASSTTADHSADGGRESADTSQGAGESVDTSREQTGKTTETVDTANDRGPAAETAATEKSVAAAAPDEKTHGEAAAIEKSGEVELTEKTANGDAAETNSETEGELRNLAVTAQLEQLVQQLIEVKFQVTGVLAKCVPIEGPSSEIMDTNGNKVNIAEGRETAEAKEAEVKGIAGAKDANSDAKDITEKKDTTEVKKASEEHGSEEANEMTDVEMADIEMTDVTGVNGAEVKETTETKETDMNGSTVVNGQIKGRETIVSDMNGKKRTKETKGMTTKVTDTVDQPTAAGSRQADCSSQAADSMACGALFSADKVLRVIGPPPGFDFLPKLTWPVSERLGHWASRPREGPELPPLARAMPAVMYGVLIDPNMLPVVKERRQNSQPQGGARRKVHPTPKFRRKSGRSAPTPAKQTASTSNRPGNTPLQPTPYAWAAQPPPPPPSDTSHSRPDLSLLCSGRPSPRKLAAAVTVFRRKCEAACEAGERRAPPGPEKGELRGTEESPVLRSGIWWRREVHWKLRRRSRAGVWFERRFERGVVWDPPPPANYTGFSTTSYSDLSKPLDPKVFPRISAISLGLLWAPEGTKTSSQGQDATPAISEFLHLNTPTSRVDSGAKVCPSGTQPVTYEHKVLNITTPKSANSSASDVSGGSTEDARQNGERIGLATEEPNQEDGQKQADKSANVTEEQRVETMEDITENYLRMGGSLADIMSMVNKPQQVIKTAMEAVEETNFGTTKEIGKTEDTGETSDVGSGDGATARTEGSVRVTEENTGETNDTGKSIRSDNTERANSTLHGERKCTGSGADGTAAENKGTNDDIIGGPPHADGESDGATERTENTAKEAAVTAGEPRCTVDGLGDHSDLNVSPGDRTQLEVVEAIAMELDEAQVFTGTEQEHHTFTNNDPEHYESHLSDIDARMRRCRERSDFFRQEGSRVTHDVDSIRQSLPEMDDMFASLRNFSAAVLSGVKAKEENAKRKPFPGGDLPELPGHQEKSSEKKPSRSAKKKSGGRKRTENPDGGVSSSQVKKTPDRQSKEEVSPEQKPDATPKSENDTTPKSENPTKPTSDTGSSRKAKRKRSKSNKMVTSTSTSSQTLEYPRLVDGRDLRQVEGLPPVGSYLHQEVIQPAEFEGAASSETGEERTDLLSPLGRLALAMPNRFMSSKQLWEVHTLLRTDGDGASESSAIEALRCAQDPGGHYLGAIHRFFQVGCDRRFHHVRLEGRTPAIEGVSSCGMLEYLRVNQWRCPALVCPNTFISGRGCGDGTAPNPFRTNAEIEAHIESGDMMRVTGITAYIRAVVMHICQGLIGRLERRPVDCAAERDAVADIVTVLLHRRSEAAQQPARIVQTYSLHNDGVLEGEMRHFCRFVTLRCQGHTVPVDCPNWSCRLWLGLLHETCRLLVEGEHKFVEFLDGQQRARLAAEGARPPSYRSAARSGRGQRKR